MKNEGGWEFCFLFGCVFGGGPRATLFMGGWEQPLVLNEKEREGEWDP